MKPNLRSIALLLALTGLVSPVSAQVPKPGGGAFCPFELPAEDSGKRRLINLAIVQYVEITATEFKLVYGGGAFGSGYEIRMPLNKPEDGKAFLDRMNAAAASCR